jgi:HEAT repeat protein
VPLAGEVGLAQERVEKLRKALQDVSPAVRAAAAESLERLEASANLERFAALLGGRNPQAGATPGPDAKDDKVARIRAVYALGEIGGEAVLAPLVGALGDPVHDVRCAAIRVLGELHEPRTLGPLFDLLDDNDPSVRALVIEALGNFQDRRLAECFLALLGSDNPEILRRVANAIARLREPRAEGALLSLLDHEEAEVREAAAAALGQLD